jgi:hypothetical protein
VNSASATPSGNSGFEGASQPACPALFPVTWDYLKRTSHKLSIAANPLVGRTGEAKQPALRSSDKPGGLSETDT